MKKFGLSFICGIVMVLFAIVAIILPTATGITASASFGGLGTLTVNWTGYQLIFGDSENKVDMVPGLLVAWIFLLLAALAGIGALVILLLKKDKKVAQFNASNLLFACAGLLAFVAGILFFCAKPLSGATDESYKLGAGFVIGGISALISGIAGIGAFVCPIVIKK